MLMRHKEKWFSCIRFLYVDKNGAGPEKSEAAAGA